MRLIAAYDLCHVQRHVSQVGKHPKLAKAIRKAASAGTIDQDLKTARSSLEQIALIQDYSGGRIGSLPGGLDESLLTGALFDRAIVLYARATSTKGDRFPLLGEAKLNQASKATHDEAMAYRNRVIAHFGRGENLEDGVMANEAVIWRVFDDGGKQPREVVALSIRAQNKAAFAGRLAALVEVRIDEIAQRMQALFEEVDEQFLASLLNDPELKQFLPSFEFDEEQFCPSPETAEELRAYTSKGEFPDVTFATPSPKREE